jgi:hypothetical protein
MTKDLSHDAIRARWVAAVERRVREWGKPGVAARAGVTPRTIENWLGVEKRSGGRTGSGGRRKTTAGERVGTVPPVAELARACEALALDVRHVLYGDVPAFPLEDALAAAVREALAGHEGFAWAEIMLGQLSGAALLEDAVARVRAVADAFRDRNQAAGVWLDIRAALEDVPIPEPASQRLGIAMHALTVRLNLLELRDATLDRYFPDR